MSQIRIELAKHLGAQNRAGRFRIRLDVWLGAKEKMGEMKHARQSSSLRTERFILVRYGSWLEARAGTSFAGRPTRDGENLSRVAQIHPEFAVSNKFTNRRSSLQPA